MAAKTFRSLTPATQVYLVTIVVAGAVTVVLSLNDFLTGQIKKDWLLLAALTLVSGSATVRLRSVPVAISISETFVFTSAILFGPSAGTLTVALDAAVISFWSYRRGQPLFKILFNICALPLTIWLASHLFFSITRFPPLFGYTDPVSIQEIFWPLILFTVVYFSLSTWIITWAIAAERQMSPLKIWRENFAWVALNYFGGASVAAFVISYAKNLDYSFLIIIVPLLAVLYATYAVSIGRVEDANQHLSQLNSLYMSTIETLAMAIDAKDQVTHGHIRRVQTYAVGLAKRLGVTDDSLIKAVEAAALLHDMGKLAVPEYILNKPGPLSESEFERIKLHASAGADILSAIPFPYPVVPIVRHHHENWDGTGYPDGLKGTDIPIGARILSVVDCFDALTSDRPYRPRLPDSEALRILLQRRGTMYDPLIVDLFAQFYSELAPPQTFDSDARLSAISRLSSPPVENTGQASRFDEIAASAEEMLVLYELARSLTGEFGLADGADVISKHLRRIVPASTCAFFVYDKDKDELACAHASGDHSGHFSGLRIARGQRLTGWVAANKKTILNSDPVLDLGEMSRSLKPRLRSCLSTPLLHDNQLVGVLTVYSTESSAFTDDHSRIVEVIARQVSRTMKHAIDVERDRSLLRTDQITGLPNVARLERLVTDEINGGEEGTTLSIVLIEVDVRWSKLTDLDIRAELWPHIISAIRRSLRGADILFGYSSRELAVLLTRTEPAAAEVISKRIAERLADIPVATGTVVARVGVASAPVDGISLSELVGIARGRFAPVTTTAVPPSSIH